MATLSLRSDTTPIDPSFTADYVQQDYLQNYLDLAMLVVLVYHTCKVPMLLFSSAYVTDTNNSNHLG